MLATSFTLPSVSARLPRANISLDASALPIQHRKNGRAETRGATELASVLVSKLLELASVLVSELLEASKYTASTSSGDTLDDNTLGRIPVW